MNNLRISGSQANPRSESDINVNFSDGTQIISASNAINDANQAQFYSTDGGTTWNQTTLPLNASDALHSDPALGWTSDGTAWAITIGINGATFHLRCFKSTDGGATWTYDADASGAQTSPDKELMCIDHSPSSPFQNNIYVIWHNGSPAFVNRRTGPGGSWQTPIQVSGAETTGTGIGGDITTNSFGDVFAFWPDTGSSSLFVRKSTDGGVTFPNASVQIATTFDSYDIGIPSFVTRRALIYISAAARRTSTEDLVFATWIDKNSAAAEPGSDITSSCKTRIWFSRSIDGGATWQAAKMINNQASKNDQFNHRLSIDENTGQLAVMYYDTVSDSGRLKTDVWLQTSDDNGVTWSAAIKVSTAQTDETSAGADSGNQYGDYNGLSGLNGNFFPSWTDRRSGSAEEIWIAPVRTTKDSFFIIQRSTFGEDEVNGLLLQSPGAAPVPEAFWVVVEGFSAADLGINAGNQGNPPIKPIITFSPGVTGMSAHCTGVIPEDISLPPAFQRFRFTFEILFTNSSGFNFVGIKIVTLTAVLNALGTTIISSGQIELIKQANPYITNGATSWLSIDLRVFQIKTNDLKFGNTMTGSDAPTFIQSVMSDLTTGHGSAGGQSFELDLSTNEDTSAIQLSPTDADGNAVFNFALARVRLTGVSTVAQKVRVFFRLFQAQSTSTSFDVNSSYRRFSDGTLGGHTIPLAGIQNNEYVTIPCFAEARIITSSASMITQLDDHNVKNITPDPLGTEVDTFFGCWIDSNQPTIKVLPASPPSGNVDGPFSGTLESVQDVISRSGHQCLVAEIAFDPFTIPNNADPSTSDKLAQRNLAFGPAPNPGVDKSRRVPQTFEIKATTPLILKTGLEPDEIMIDWRNLPAGTTAQIYLPATDANKILEMANQRYSWHNLSLIDPSTLQCKAEKITYIPIPFGTDINFAGLLTIDLPSIVKKGQRFDVIVRQITSAIGRGKRPSYTQPQLETYSSANNTRGLINWRRVFGSFQIVIPIGTKELLLNREEHLYSIMQWIQNKIPLSSRWYPVFQRYVMQIGGRVTGFGGDPNAIEPSPYGIWQKPRHPHHTGYDEVGEERITFTGKVSGIIFDHFGDFEGFYLETEDGERCFKSREHEVEDLAQLAWKERIFVNILVELHAPHTPVSIVLRSAPRPFQN